MPRHCSIQRTPRFKLRHYPLRLCNKQLPSLTRTASTPNIFICVPADSASPSSPRIRLSDGWPRILSRLECLSAQPARRQRHGRSRRPSAELSCFLAAQAIGARHISRPPQQAHRHNLNELMFRYNRRLYHHVSFETLLGSPRTTGQRATETSSTETVQKIEHRASVAQPTTNRRT
jgi:hypothetical protein